MIIEPPERQHPSVRRWNLDVKTLEAKTMEAMGNWFNDAAHPANASKKVFLKEIFKVAKAEERYKNGEIGMLPRYLLGSCVFMPFADLPSR